MTMQISMKHKDSMALYVHITNGKYKINTGDILCSGTQYINISSDKKDISVYLGIFKKKINNTAKHFLR